jgi:hypothetical protein
MAILNGQMEANKYKKGAIHEYGAYRFGVGDFNDGVRKAFYRPSI